MPSARQLSELLASLYEAATDPVLWPVFLEKIGKAADCSHVYVCARSARTDLEFDLIHGFTEQEEHAYLDYFCSKDIVLHGVSREVQTRSSWAGQLEDLVPSSEVRASEIYNDFMRPAGIEQSICVALSETGPFWVSGVALWRGPGLSPFAPTDVLFLETLTAHLRQAFLLQAKLMALQERSLWLEAGLDASGTAVLGLNSAGCIVQRSAGAQLLLDGGNGVWLSGGRLRAACAQADRELQRTLVGAAAAAQGVALAGNTAPGGALLVPRAEGKVPLQVLVCPFRGLPTASGVTTLVFLCDPAAQPVSRQAVLQTLYRLTPVEGRLAKLLLGGAELRDAGEQLSMTYETARFHLKQVFVKTGARRQAELFQIASRLPL